MKNNLIKLKSKIYITRLNYQISKCIKLSIIRFQLKQQIISLGRSQIKLLKNHKIRTKNEVAAHFSMKYIRDLIQRRVINSSTDIYRLKRA